MSLPSLLAHTEPQTAKANHHENIGAIELDGEALDSQVQQWGGDGGIAVPAQASGNPAQGQQVPAVESLGQRASPGGSGDDDPGGALCRDDIQICLTAEGRKCRLGEGGFGVVYKALMNGVDEVAVKLVKVWGGMQA